MAGRGLTASELGFKVTSDFSGRRNPATFGDTHHHIGPIDNGPLPIRPNTRGRSGTITNQSGSTSRARTTYFSCQS